jgi:hypothetical protein
MREIEERESGRYGMPESNRTAASERIRGSGSGQEGRWLGNTTGFIGALMHHFETVETVERFQLQSEETIAAPYCASAEP